MAWIVDILVQVGIPIRVHTAPALTIPMGLTGHYLYVEWGARGTLADYYGDVWGEAILSDQYPTYQSGWGEGSFSDQYPMWGSGS